jgi:dolichol-phosphate mannosyltransferase
MKYLMHLRRLLIFKYPNRSYLLQFIAVGASGTAVNLATLTALVAAGARESIAVGGGIVVSLLTNFLLNRRFTFGYARGGSALAHFVGFTGASALGMVVNYAATLMFRDRVPSMPIQVAALVGIACGMGLNFVTSRYLVFRKPKATSSPRDLGVKT